MKLHSPLVLAFLFGVASAAKEKVVSKRKQTRRKLSSFLNSDYLKIPDRGGPFERTYRVVSEDGNQAFYGGILDGAAGRNEVLGSVFSYSGNIFDPSTVKLSSSTSQQFEKRVEDIADPKADYTFNAQCKCTGTESSSLTTSAHSCVFDLCLGGGGFNCVNLYSGTPFRFVSEKPISSDGNVPPFPLTVIGGTGSFFQVKGSATLTTIAGRTLFGNSNPQTGSIVQDLVISTNIELPPAP